MILRKVLFRHDHHVRLATFKGICFGSWHQNLNRDARRLALDLRKCSTHENCSDVVRHDQPEGAI
jgi:hypothetical protein